MNTILAWMGLHPFLTFFLAYTAYLLACFVVRQTVWLIALPVRAMNIRKHGWPPEHLDADGDYKKPKAGEAK